MKTGLQYVVWELTLRCDLACAHCGSRAGKARENELSTAEAVRVAGELAAMGAREITLIGGEAYLHVGFPEVVAAIVRHGVTCSMTTGGRGLTRDRIVTAKAAGIQSVSVSIDGLKASHDLQRGLQGSFDAAVVALDSLAAEGVPRTVNTQINRLSRPDLAAVLDLVIEKGANAWQVQFTVPMGRAADRPDWLLEPFDLLEVMPELAALANRAKRHGVRLWPANNVGYFGPHESEIRGDFAHSGGCIAGKHALGLESDGTVKGCPSLPTSPYRAGNVRDASIQQLWDSEPALRFTRDEAVELWGFCASCYYASICRAGCTWTAHVILGRPGNNPYCHHRALELASQGLRERLVAVERAPGIPFDHGRFEIVVEPSSDKARRALPVGGVTRELLALEVHEATYTLPGVQAASLPRRRLPIL